MRTDISCVWTALWNALNIKAHATIIEVGPGFKSKIGAMLHRVNFSGTLYIVEPNSMAGQYTVQRYENLLPHARIVLLATYLNRITREDVPGSVDAILANHVLDDMVLGECVGADCSREFFSMNSSPERINSTRALWERVNDVDLECAITSVSAQWFRVIEHLKPTHMILSQYESNTLRTHGIHKPHHAGTAVLSRIRQRYTHVNQTDSILTHLGHKHEEWLVNTRKTHSLSVDGHGTPVAMARLHSDIFCEEKARVLDHDEYDVAYVNKKLLCELYPEMRDMSDDLIATYVGETFALRLVTPEDPPCAHTTLVYSDKQKDPTNIALDNHKGSGRACYVGSRFNIKGIGKTKLLGTPKDPIHATGNLDLITALREAVMSSWINERISHGTSQAIAVIALNETAEFPWSETPIRLALLVRLDDGTLDRPSHLVHTRPNRSVNLETLTASYARMDADLFAHRVLHGAWSTGNVSLSGNILDMESVSFLRGRGMHCNITSKYESNRFGRESLGWKQVIEQVAHALDQGLMLPALMHLFDAERTKRMHANMLRILGFPDVHFADIMRVCETDVSDLTQQFVRLSTIQSGRAYDANVFHSAEHGTHVCDMTYLRYENPDVLIRAEEARWLSPKFAAQLRQQVTHFVAMVRTLISRVYERLHITRDTALAEYMHRSLPNFFELTGLVADITRTRTHFRDVRRAVQRLIDAY